MMTPKAYFAFIDQLTANLQADTRVLGLVLAGSTANMSHAPDAWSDHDFFVITDDDSAEYFRTHFDWLPDSDHIVLTVDETQHGRKVLYASGHILEFASFTLEELRMAKSNDYKVVFDKGGVAAVMQATYVPPHETAPNSATFKRDAGMFLSLLVVGAGRVMRGEIISGQQFIRVYALSHLMPLLAWTLPADDKSQLDNLDPLRRFEKTFPDVGAELVEALNVPALEGARRLLAIYERTFSDHPDHNAEATATVKRFLDGLDG
jgi:hypothetical protein